MDGGSEVLSEIGASSNIAVPPSDTVSDQNQAKQETLEKKAVHLRLVLEKDFKAADIKWSLFVAAAFSFRYESCLRPFPPAFMKKGLKDMDELLSVITDVPALDLVLQYLDNLEDLTNISDIINLLFYVLVRLKEPTVKAIPQELYDSIICSKTMSSSKPQHIFQISGSNKSTAEAKWRDLAKNHRTFYAYHGNRLENFYSILNFGFQQHFNKNALVGNGIYLSKDLDKNIPYSHGGFGWGASCIGGHLSCIALCEVIDVPDGINYQKPVSSKGDALNGDEQFKILSEIAAEEQNCSQYIVTNYDLVRLRYLLVYAKQSTSMRFPTTISNGQNVGGFRMWFSRHKLFSILFGYGLMLATIGFANNQPMHYYYKMLLKKLDIAYSSVKV